MKAILFFLALLSLASSPLMAQTTDPETTVEAEGKVLPQAGFLSPMQLTLAYDYIDPEVHPDMEDISLKGVNVGLGFEYTLPEGFSTTTRPSFSYNAGSDNYFFGRQADHEVNTKIVRVGQSLNYDLPAANIIFQPFIELAVGYGWWESDVTETGAGTTEFTGDSTLLEAGAGVNAKFSNGLMPFFKVAIRDFDIDEVRQESANVTQTIKLTDADEYDFGGTNFLLGLGYAF